MEHIDKQEALRQIETIKKAVIERRYAIPDTPGHYFAWATLSAGGITIDDWNDIFASLFDISHSTILAIYLGIMIAVGFAASGWFFSKELKRTEEICTPQLKALQTIYLCSIGFASIISVALASSSAGVYIYGIWIFAIGFSMYVENVISKSFFGNLGLLLVLVAAAYVLGSYAYLGKNPTGSQICLIAETGKYLSLVFISGVLGYLGLKLLLKRKKNV